jgi:hypothetical protein
MRVRRGASQVRLAEVLRVVAAAATHSTALVVWLLPAGNGARVQAAFFLRGPQGFAVLADRQGQKAPTTTGADD